VVTWTIPSLASGATVVRTLVARVDQAPGGDTAIVNAWYGASDGVDPPAAGPPVSVRLRAPAPASMPKQYLAHVAR
jgi:hypothetical protein